MRRAFIREQSRVGQQFAASLTIIVVRVNVLTDAARSAFAVGEKRRRGIRV